MHNIVWLRFLGITTLMVVIKSALYNNIHLKNISLQRRTRRNINDITSNIILVLVLLKKQRKHRVLLSFLVPVWISLIISWNIDSAYQHGGEFVHGDFKVIGSYIERYNVIAYRSITKCIHKWKAYSWWCFHSESNCGVAKKKKNKKAIMLKLDFHKACDSVRWSLLKQVMDCMGL